MDGCAVTINTESMSMSQSNGDGGDPDKDVTMVPSTEDPNHDFSNRGNGNNNSKLVVDDGDDDDDTDDDDDDDDDRSHASSMQALQEQCEEDQDDFNPWQFIASLPHYRTVAHLTPPVSLPPKDPRHPPLTLVLDLDETLVHCTVEACSGADFEIPVVFHGVSYQVHVRQRPFLKEFLDKIRDKYEVVIFTASQKVYADTLLNQLDPGMHEYTNMYELVLYVDEVYYLLMLLLLLACFGFFVVSRYFHSTTFLYCTVFACISFHFHYY